MFAKLMKKSEIFYTSLWPGSLASAEPAAARWAQRRCQEPACVVGGRASRELGWSAGTSGLHGASPMGNDVGQTALLPLCP